MPNRNDDFCVEFVNSIDQTRGLYQDVSIDGKKMTSMLSQLGVKQLQQFPKILVFGESESLLKMKAEMKKSFMKWDLTHHYGILSK